jgi:hypothetical protein
MKQAQLLELCAPEGTRTPDILGVNEALYQLSYKRMMDFRNPPQAFRLPITKEISRATGTS